MSNEAALSLANARVDTSAALRGWLERECGLGSRESNEVALRLPEFVSLQASVRELLDASIRGGPFPAAALDRLNDASARVPRVLRFDANGACETPIASSATPAVLARIAWSAIELLGAAERERPRRCGACGRYFLTTRSDRVWCSDACGNRTRVARHHARRRTRA
jgi:predicted RNA-binding Zn ribbon-like protein